MKKINHRPPAKKNTIIAMSPPSRSRLGNAASPGKYFVPSENK